MRTALCLILCAVVAQAADTSPPAIKLMTPGLKPVMVQPAAPPLKVGDYQWFKLDNYVGLTTWEVEGDSAVIHELEKPVQRIDWPDGTKPPVVTDLPAGVLLVRGMKPGDVKLSAWGVVDNRAKRLATIVLTVEGARPPPVSPLPPVEPPGKEGIYFMIVTPNTPTSPKTLEVMRLSAWGELEKAGHKYGFASVAEANVRGTKIESNITAPLVVPLKLNGDGTINKAIPPPMALPDTNEGVLKLMEVKP